MLYKQVVIMEMVIINKLHILPNLFKQRYPSYIPPSVRQRYCTIHALFPTILQALKYCCEKLLGKSRPFLLQLIEIRPLPRTKIPPKNILKGKYFGGGIPLPQNSQTYCQQSFHLKRNQVVRDSSVEN